MERSRNARFSAEYKLNQPKCSWSLPSRFKCYNCPTIIYWLPCRFKYYSWPAFMYRLQDYKTESVGNTINITDFLNTSYSVNYNMLGQIRWFQITNYTNCCCLIAIACCCCCCCWCFCCYCCCCCCVCCYYYYYYYYYYY